MADNDRKSHHDKATPAEQIALFRYGIIAPILHDSSNGQTRYFKQMAQKVFDVPIYGRKKYHWKTFKSWLRSYRRAGSDGLKPKTRADKGISRMVDDGLAQIIQQKYQQFPALNAALLYRILVDEGYIHHGLPCEATVRKYIQQHQLKPQADPPQPRKKFSSANQSIVKICRRKIRETAYQRPVAIRLYAWTTLQHRSQTTETVPVRCH